MKNRSLVLTVSLIAMMIVGVAHGAQIASTDYVTKSIGDEADMVWDSFDKLHAGLETVRDETTGTITSIGAIDAAVDAANKYTDDEITAAMENAGLNPDAELSTTSTNPVQNKVVTAALNDKLDADGSIAMDQVTGLSEALANAGSKPDAELSTTSENSVQNKVVTAALDDKLGKDEKAASAATADSATTAGSATKATQDASGHVITETYATKGELPGAATASVAGIMKWGQIPSGSATATTSATIWVQ